MLKTQSFLPFLIFTTLIIAVLFYWFQLRPSMVRQKCYSYTLEKREERVNSEKPLTNKEANNYYRRCFAENGLKPEDLVK